MTQFHDAVRDRLIRYAKVDTQSAAVSDSVPTTMKQFDLARLLKEELEKIGEEQQRPEVCSDAKRLQELSLRAAQLSEALEEAYAAWSALSEELEAAGA